MLPNRVSTSQLLQILACFACLALATAAKAANSAWKPDKNVEIVVSSAAGGGNDRTARLIQRILQADKDFDVTVSVMNKPGGGGAIAWTYLNQYKGNGHYLATSISSLLTNHITGRSPVKHTDFSPITQLFSEYIAFMVKADSPLQTGKALAERLKSNPGELRITVGAGVGNHNHIALGKLAKSLGLNARELKVVIFKSSGEASTALMGGHIDLAISPASSAMNQQKSGGVKIVAITAPKRLGGALATVPTWQEQGFPVVVENWRGIIGPGGLSAPQVQYWEATLAKVVKTEDWQKDLARNNMQDTFGGAAEARKFLDAEYASYEEALTDLGLVKGR